MDRWTGRHGIAATFIGAAGIAVCVWIEAALLGELFRVIGG